MPEKNKRSGRAPKKATKKSKQILVPGINVALLPGLEPLLVPVDSIKPDPRNPRIRKRLEELVGSITRFGLRKPIVANKRDGVIEAGHQTLAALQEIGATQVPVVWADDDRMEATAFNIADNRSAEVVATWDEDGLKALIQELNDEDLISGIDYDEEEINNILGTFTDGDFGPPPSEPPEPSGGEPAKNQFKVVIECDDEQEQTHIINRLTEQGIECKALIL